MRELGVRSGVEGLGKGVIEGLRGYGEGGRVLRGRFGCWGSWLGWGDRVRGKMVRS